MTMTIEEAAEHFLELYSSMEVIKSMDVPALRYAWNVFVDDLNRDGRITDADAMNWQNPFLSEKDR